MIDVRIFDGRGAPQFGAQLLGFNVFNDEVSRVWSTNVTATVASGMDTIGLDTLIQFSPVPSLTVAFYPEVCQGCASNLVQVSWPAQPTNFILQAADRGDSLAIWRQPTNQVFGSPDPLRGGWFIQTAADKAGPTTFYRLIWPNGQQ